MELHGIAAVGASSHHSPSEDEKLKDCMGVFSASWVVNHASHGYGEMAFQCLLNSFFQRFGTHTPKLHTILHL